MIDVAEGLLGRRVAQGDAGDPHLELGPLEADGVVVDTDGTPIHVEFQTRADRAMGLRMARYFAALARAGRPAPEQHVVLLHPDADYPGIGSYRHGRLTLHYAVHRLWEVDAEVLLARPGLLRLVPLARLPARGGRAELLSRTARAIRERLAGDDADLALFWAGQLATLYLSPEVISDILEASYMRIDLSHTTLATQSRAEGLARGRAEGRAEGLADARREDVRRIVIGRFGDAALAERAAGVSEDLLEDAIDITATAASAAEIATWLETHDTHAN